MAKTSAMRVVGMNQTEKLRDIVEHLNNEFEAEGSYRIKRPLSHCYIAIDITEISDTAALQAL